jgi:thiosulfate reductase cytochrome b subunit
MNKVSGHRVWVRISHWLGAFSVIALMISGWAMLMTNPNLYWGEVGNPLVPAFLELPVSENYRHGGWSEAQPFFEGPDSPVTANRGYDILNLNSWGRSLHFLAAWVLVFTGLAYLLLGFLSGHIRHDLLPGKGEWSARPLWADLRSYLRLQLTVTDSGPPYGVLQKWAYFLVLFLVVPLLFLTGLTMSPAVTAAFPLLLDLFGGYQSARTIHFFAFCVLALFVLVHLLMVLLTGPARQLRGMTLGTRNTGVHHDG